MAYEVATVRMPAPFQKLSLAPNSVPQFPSYSVRPAIKNPQNPLGIAGSWDVENQAEGTGVEPATVASD